MILTFIVLNVADAVLTCIALKKGATEGNPVMNLFHVTQPLSIVVWKAVFVVAILLILWSSKRLTYLRAASIVLALVCIWNVIVIIIGR